jgi:diguanylate cyclase (GGDEF)-like protein
MEIRRARRYEHAFAVAMCDLDHFKKINDTHGHQCGDKVLKHFVAGIRDLIRTDSDWIARYGGEEFLLVLPETSLENAHKLCERLRKNIEKTPIIFKRKKITITASFGVTGFSSRSDPVNLNLDSLIHRADEYLYNAKESGRNTVISGPFTSKEIN